MEGLSSRAHRKTVSLISSGTACVLDPECFLVIPGVFSAPFLVSSVGKGIPRSTWSWALEYVF